MHLFFLSIEQQGISNVTVFGFEHLHQVMSKARHIMKIVNHSDRDWIPAFEMVNSTAKALNQQPCYAMHISDSGYLQPFAFCAPNQEEAQEQHKKALVEATRFGVQDTRVTFI